MIYINEISCISPEPTLNQTEFLADIRKYKTNMLQCIEPDYQPFFDSNSIRRLSRVIKMGWAGAKSCLQDAGLLSPESICIGTGKGCFKSTQEFMFSVDDNQEEFIPPSPFIQSAHSSIAAQIAIQSKCSGYNMTYSHRAFSFEHALYDAFMLLDEGKYKNVLVGGVDEIDDIHFQTFDRIGHYKKPGTNNLELLKYKTKGTIAGEGSCFFMIEDQAGKKTIAGIQAVNTFSIPVNNDEIIENVRQFIGKENLSFSDIDLVIFGLNGDTEFDPVYHQLMDSVFSNTNQAYYKHLCGEYHTSSAFAMWLAANIIQKQEIPEILLLNQPQKKPINKVLIHNHYRNVNHSLILVSKP
jgi:3-oxoacyl-[acyl-carrier-protein] synthase II